VRDSASI